MKYYPKRIIRNHILVRLQVVMLRLFPVFRSIASACDKYFQNTICGFKYTKIYVMR